MLYRNIAKSFRSLVKSCYGASRIASFFRLAIFAAGTVVAIAISVMIIYVKLLPYVNILARCTKIDSISEDCIENRFWYTWTNEERLLFLGFCNNIRSIMEPEKDVMELLEVYSVSCCECMHARS